MHACKQWLAVSQHAACIWLRFAHRLQDHNKEFNPSGVVDQSRKRASDADSSETKRQKLEDLDEADWAELMKARPVSIVEFARYTLMLARPANEDSAGTVWISSKCDMVLDVDEVLFSFGAGRRRALLMSSGLGLIV